MPITFNPRMKGSFQTVTVSQPTRKNKMTEKPNILIIHADQMRYDCASFSGNPDVKTPHLERLAIEGVCFDEAFVSYPLCRPFRASFQTGKYPQRTGAYGHYSLIDPDQPSLARSLNAVGYKSGYVGKWHLHNDFISPGFVPPGPDRMGFDDFTGFNRDHCYTNAIFYRDTDQPFICRRFEPDFQTDHAIEFMERASESGAPFLAYVSFGPPHPPISLTPRNWMGMYDPMRLAMPKGVSNPKFKRPPGGKGGGRDQPWLDSQVNAETRFRRFLSGYYGLISNIDYNVGRMLNWLDANSLSGSTIVLFISDHGEMFGQHGGYVRSKNAAYRASAQVPLLARYPGHFARNKRVNSLVDVAVDTMPTLLDACGVESPEGTQGISYLSLLEGGDVPTRDHVQYQRIANKPKSDHDAGKAVPSSLRGIRTRDWLYVRNCNGPVLLFDENEDRGELANLAKDPAHADIRAQLDARVCRNMEETGDAWRLAADPKSSGMPTLDEIKANREKAREIAIEVP